MRNVSQYFFYLFIFLLFHVTPVFATRNCDGSNVVPQYGFGKLYYEGELHSRESIYPLSEALEYNFKSSKAATTERLYNNAKDVSAFIGVNTIGDHVIVTFKVNNDSKTTIAIPKKNIPNNEGLAGSVFFITSECVNLDYLGPVVNFGGDYIYPEDYVSIKPGGVFIEMISLDEYYHFLPGRHYYEIEIPNIPVLFKKKATWDELITGTNKITVKVDSLFVNRKIKASYCVSRKCDWADIRWINQEDNGSIYKTSGQQITVDSFWIPLVGFDEKPHKFSNGERLPQWESNGERFDIKWIFVP